MEDGMLQGQSYDELCRNFRWNLPAEYNIGWDVCDKWAGDAQRLALINVSPERHEQRFTFRALKTLSNRLANALAGNGIGRGDRIAILLPQCPETLLCHIAAYKMGAIAVPLLTLFGPMALEFRLRDSGARVVVTDSDNLPKINEIRERLPDLQRIVVVGAQRDAAALDFWRSIESGAEDFVPVRTRPADPALIIYTSGTTGPPKGTLHGHQLLPGILPGFEFFHNLFPRKGDLLYTPLDWAYIGGSYDALFPSLHHGVPVLAYRPRKFDPERALDVMARYGVRNLMVVPTVLRIMKNAVANPQRFGIRLRSLTAGGEAMDDGLQDWSRHTFGVPINQQYGQTECDLVIGDCAAVMEIQPGTIGKAVPGHTVAVIDEQGRPLEDGALGEIAVRRPDPVMFLKYWNQPAATHDKFVGDWMLTGDTGHKDGRGWFRFAGRKDDLIESGGFRIGPGEIEDCLMQHASVALACVLGVADPVRGQAVKAFIVPRPGVTVDRQLEDRIREHVKSRLEAHATPREIQFLDRMPMTASGKIRKSDLRKLHAARETRQESS
jgi:acetyl-CoA synthetase